MIETTERRRAVDSQIATILERMNAQDKMLGDIKESILGTMLLKGSAAELRELVAWRAELEGAPGTPERVPLKQQIAEFRKWQNEMEMALNRLTWYVLVPLMITLVLALGGFLWAILVHKVEISAP